MTRFSPDRADFLFVHVADSRRWFIAARDIGGATCIRLGGPKCAGFEVDPADRSLQASAIRR